jgi:hypothetical protein
MLRRKAEIIKEILKRIHKGEDIEKVKQELKDVLSSVNPWEIPFIEQELIREGISPWEIVSMCDIHVEIFRESLIDREELRNLTPGHPLHTLLMENEEIIKDVEKLTLFANSLTIGAKGRIKDLQKALFNQVIMLLDVRKHFMKEQLLLYPYLEVRGITAVPRVLWTKQDQAYHKVRTLMRALQDATKKNFTELMRELKELSNEVARALTDMVFRENKILYPTLYVLLSEGEWAAIKQEESTIGYYKVRPQNEWHPRAEPVYPYQVKASLTDKELSRLPKEIQVIIRKGKSGNEQHAVNHEVFKIKGDIDLDSGFLTKEELNAILTTLPVDISFVDREGKVKFYNNSPNKIFPRAKTVLGRPVQLCHPPRSVHIVEKILQEFKAGRKDMAEFWIRMGEKFIHIRYFPVRNKSGDYIGTLEVVQDITQIKKLEGEKRLLDWK